MQQLKKRLLIEGFAVIDGIYNDQEINQIIAAIDYLDHSAPTFRKSEDLFAVRKLLKEAPEIKSLIFSDRLKTALNELFGTGYFVTKSIYFDKPATSNWFVAYHQDLTISVDQQKSIDGFSKWTVKQNQYAVQPPLSLLQDNFTIRIHLNHTDENNGALKVIPKSHLKDIYRPENIDWSKETEVSCNVRKGGIMLMKPLLLHSSSRTTNHQRRRVIHIEFSRTELPEGLAWAERLDLE